MRVKTNHIFLLCLQVYGISWLVIIALLIVMKVIAAIPCKCDLRLIVLQYLEPVSLLEFLEFMLGIFKNWNFTML